MLSSSRSKANGFSLRGCGSERCRRRVLGPAWRSLSAEESLSGAGSAPSPGCCPSARGTGVQGCQELVEGALHEARRSSADGRACEGPEEPPGLAAEVDLIKDISLGRVLRACTAAVIARIQLCISSGLSAWM